MIRLVTLHPTYLPIYLKLMVKKVLSIFDSFYQDQAQSVTWVNRIALLDHEKDLEEGNKKEFNFVDIVEKEKKPLRE